MRTKDKPEADFRAEDDVQRQQQGERQEGMRNMPPVHLRLQRGQGRSKGPQGNPGHAQGQVDGEKQRRSAKAAAEYPGKQGHAAVNEKGHGDPHQGQGNTKMRRERASPSCEEERAK